MPTRRVLLAAAPLVLATPLGAQRAGVTQVPDSVVAAVDRAFAFAGPTTPGCAVGVSRDGAAVLTRAYGMANLEYDVPNTPETIFESGSVAKQFTAAAVMLLAQEGKLSLDDDIRKHLPEVPDFGRTITIRHLLTHTSGLRDQWGLLSLTGNPPGRQVHGFNTILDLVSRQRALNFAPGEEYLYSNTGYTLAAIIVQRASGKSFAQFSEERIFRPLGMASTRWRDDFARIVKQRATAYAGSPQVGYRQEMSFTNVVGNGGLLTTVADLIRWNAFLDAPSAEVGGRALVEALETEGRLNDGRPIGYGLGLGVSSTGGRRVVSHSGSTAGYQTWVARYPQQRVSVSVLCNGRGTNPTRLGNQVAALFVPAPRDAQTAQAGTPANGPALSTTELARFTGTFHAPRTGQVIRAAMRDTLLVVTVPGSATLSPVGRDRFRIPGQGELQYLLDGGRVREVLRIADDDTTRYQPAPPADTSLAALAAYEGTYRSPELDTPITVKLKDGKLVAIQRPLEESVLQPLFRDAFSADGYSLIFTRKEGKVDGFGVWAGRVRNVRFERQ